MSKQFVVEVEDSVRVVRLRRTPEPFATIADVDGGFAPIHAAMAGVVRRSHGLLVDTRLGPARNDPEFERALEPHRRRTFAGFGRAAVLVQTAVGRLQVQRLARVDGFGETRVFDDEAAAMAYLATP